MAWHAMPYHKSFTTVSQYSMPWHGTVWHASAWHIGKISEKVGKWESGKASALCQPTSVLYKYNGHMSAGYKSTMTNNGYFGTKQTTPTFPVSHFLLNV